ncbi:E3 ubiquitin-protein ligase TRIM47-like isoform X2 [Myxocyprinus asiaticus]|uniref:E3 ubiquitin-protein ligase TRIM47-like isoform X2 n=1 Tax=Myxocyprinus asiaticus TaxID=70543 RepID=UPI0022214862|nr:E3 ubiquitin-protein ligase TRIM47-like isoform X2 [Myxocyprinus asiaticus]
MAESSSDDQNPFNCPICLHLLKDPVTTACGHSYCMKCIEEYWDRDSQKGVYSCPQCRQTFTPRPALSRSTVLAEVVERMKRAEPESVKASSLLGCAVSGDVECDVCMETKLKAIKSCLVCLASYCETHIQTHYTSSALKRHKLLNASPHLQQQICSQHDKPLELYCCQDQQLICMQCALINHQNHSIASPEARRKEIQRQLKSNQDGLQENIHQREMKIEELRQAVDSHKRSAQAAVKHSETIFTELISSMEKRRAEITEIIRAQEKNEVRRVDALINTLEQEISDLKKKNNELGQLSYIKDDVCFIQNFSSLSRYQCSTSSMCISVNQHLTFEEIQTIVSELKGHLDDLCEEDAVRISEKVPTVHIMRNNETITEYLPSRPKTREEFLKYSSELNLNLSSACNQLCLCGMTVSRRDSLQSSVFGTSIPPRDSGFGFTSQDRNSGFGFTSQDRNSGFGFTSQDRNSGFGFARQDRNSGFGIAGQDRNSGFGFTSQNRNSSFGFARQDRNGGFGIAGQDRNGGFGFAGQDRNGGFGFAGQDRNSGFGFAGQDRKSVFGDQGIDDRFRNVTYQVLCNESLSGRCYFEVQWRGTGCSIAFSYDQIQQGGTFAFGHNNRSWKFDFQTAHYHVWHNNQQDKIPLVSKIGVFLDQEAGIVSFYNVSDKMNLLHRIQTTFTGPLYPGFSFQDWENDSSVTICCL